MVVSGVVEAKHVGAAGNVAPYRDNLFRPTSCVTSKVFGRKRLPPPLARSMRRTLHHSKHSSAFLLDALGDCANIKLVLGPIFRWNMRQAQK